MTPVWKRLLAVMVPAWAVLPVMALNPRLCAADRPCINRIYVTNSGALYFNWDANSDYDFFQVRWSRPGRGESEHSVGTRTDYRIESARPAKSPGMLRALQRVRVLAVARASVHREVEIMALTAQAKAVADFLTSRDKGIDYSLSRLEFSIDGMGIDPQGYREMGNKILEGGITVGEASSSGKSQIAAAYTAGLDKLSLPKGESLKLEGGSGEAVGDQAGIIHEITHALFDFHGYNTTVGVEEATAYIAETLFALVRGSRRSSDDPQSDKILKAAYEVVNGRKMILQTGQKLSSRDADVRKLVEAVRAHPDYSGSANDGNHVNGIFGGLMNPWYPSKNYD
jgi:hypothetical protein